MWPRWVCMLLKWDETSQHVLLLKGYAGLGYSVHHRCINGAGQCLHLMGYIFKILKCKALFLNYGQSLLLKPENRAVPRSGAESDRLNYNVLKGCFGILVTSQALINTNRSAVKCCIQWYFSTGWHLYQSPSVCSLYTETKTTILSIL